MAKKSTKAKTKTSFPPAISFKVLKERNPCYTLDLWNRCRALYSGGATLLENMEVLKRVMPKHNAELDDTYKERLARAFYIPYPGSIIDKIVAQLMSKPLGVQKAPATTQDTEAGVVDDNEDEDLPPFYAAFFKDCSRPGGRKTSIDQLMRDQILTALQCGMAWTLIDLPKTPVEGYSNLAQQEAAGGLNAYACAIDPECVIDWEEDEAGEFTFVLLQETIAKRQSIAGNRNMITMRYRYYTPEAWAVYEFTYDKTKQPNGPTDRDEAKLVDQGPHSFKRVPVRRMKLTEGLWAMGKLEAMARAHLNQRNALSWGQLKALFPMPVLYAQAPNPTDPTTEDMGRAGQRMGAGNIWVLAEKDRLESFSPDVTPYTVAAEDLDRIRDEMHRVLHHMADAASNSAASMGRSAESKGMDQAAASIILCALGLLIREHVEDIYETVAAGRGETLGFAAKGMDQFDDTTVSQMIVDALNLEGVDIPSATWKKKWKLKVAKLTLGPDATEEEIDQIEDELEGVITQDQHEAEADADLVQAQATAETSQRTIDGKDPQTGKDFAKPVAGSKSPSKGKKSVKPAKGKQKQDGFGAKPGTPGKPDKTEKSAKD